ncbi:MAG: hypothetical protein KC616_21650 [Myxococcales bacterium]|nr:hypothetical protein [Myxococcales bacterium]
MAARTIAVAGNADMSGIASTASGSDPGVDTVSIVFDDADGKLPRAAALMRAVEKLAEEGWI